MKLIFTCQSPIGVLSTRCFSTCVRVDERIKLKKINNNQRLVVLSWKLAVVVVRRKRRKGKSQGRHALNKSPIWLFEKKNELWETDLSSACGRVYTGAKASSISNVEEETMRYDGGGGAPRTTNKPPALSAIIHTRLFLNSFSSGFNLFLNLYFPFFLQKIIWPYFFRR